MRGTNVDYKSHSIKKGHLKLRLKSLYVCFFKNQTSA